MKRLNYFFFSSIDLTPMAFCRLTFGLCLGLHYLSLIGHIQDTFGPAGLGGTDFYARVPFAVDLARKNSVALSFPQLFADASLVTFAYLLLTFASFSFALGFRTQISGWIALALHTLFHARNEYAYWGWGDLIRPFMLYVLLTPSGGGYSLDHWLTFRKWRPDKFRGVAWPMRLLQIHVCTSYLVTGWCRLDDPNWQDGSMFYGILTDPLFSRINSDWRWAIPYLRPLCYLAWWSEMIAPFALWWKVTRPAIIFLLVALHLGLEATTMVGYWGFMMIAALSTFTSFRTARVEEVV